MRPLEIHPHARREFNAACDHYEEQKPGLALQFIDAFERTVEMIEGMPGLGSVVADTGHIRRVIIQDFPYYIIYQYDTETVAVYAVAHQSRRPGYWSYRL